MRTAGLILNKLAHPADAAHVARKRLEIAQLRLQNRFSRRRVVGERKTAPVVSLTSYGNRLKNVYLAIESIGRGNLLPSRMILWIDETKVAEDPPIELRRLKQRGLEIQICQNWGPHKKYYPYVESQTQFLTPLATADDDVLYPRTWLSGLAKAYETYPRIVHCYRARRVQVRDGALLPYRDWPPCSTDAAHPSVIATGVSGVIYPPQLLEAIRRAGKAFEEKCPRADDLWLHVQALRAGFSIRQIGPEPIHFPHIPGSQETSLYQENCAQLNGNDRQSAALYETGDLAMLVEPGW